MKNLEKLFQEVLSLLWRKQPESDFVNDAHIGQSSSSSKMSLSF